MLKEIKNTVNLTIHVLLNINPLLYFLFLYSTSTPCFNHVVKCEVVNMKNVAFTHIDQLMSLMNNH